MVVRVFFAGLFVSLCVATKIQYPAKDPCILIDFETNNSLSWTPDNGTEMAIPDWNISKFTVSGGSCKADVHSLTVQSHVDNATMKFDFTNTSGKVDLKITLTIVPELVFVHFNNTDNKSLEIKTDFKTGDAGQVFKCNSQRALSGKNRVGNDLYKFTLRTKNMKIQGFGVENSTFSNDTDECADDNPTTTATPNTTVTTEHANTTVTTEHANTTVTTAPQPPTTQEPKSAVKVTLNATDGNTTCAMLTGKLTLMIPYNTTGKDKKTATATVYVPKSVKSSGECMNKNNTDILKATFGDGWEMDFVFKGDGENIWWDQLNVTVVYDNNTFPGIDPKLVGTNKTFSTSFSKEYKAKKDGSYLCNSDTETDLKEGLKLKTTDLQYTALQSNVTSFSDKNIAECSADAKTSSIVPIAVGAALAGLVVIVLIAYLIGRRRNRKGYESV